MGGLPGGGSGGAACGGVSFSRLMATWHGTGGGVSGGSGGAWPAGSGSAAKADARGKLVAVLPAAQACCFSFMADELLVRPACKEPAIRHAASVCITHTVAHR